MEAARARQLMAMDTVALVAELRALSDAGSSYAEQALCCVNLSMAFSLPTGGTAEDAVRTVVSALSRGVQHATLQAAGCVALAKLLGEAPATGATAGTAGVAAVWLRCAHTPAMPTCRAPAPSRCRSLLRWTRAIARRPAPRAASPRWLPR